MEKQLLIVCLCP